jgi:hypothetical protein
MSGRPIRCCRQVKLQPPKDFGLLDRLPEMATVAQLAIVGSPDQPRGLPRAALLKQLKQVGLTVRYIDQTGFRDNRLKIADAPVSFEPAEAFLLLNGSVQSVMAVLASVGFGIPNPTPLIQDAQTEPIRSDRQSRVEMQARGGLEGQRAKSLDLRFTRVVQLGRVLNTKDDRKLLHPLQRRVAVRLQNPLPGYILVAEQTVGGLRLAPTLERRGDTTFRPPRQGRQHLLRPAAQSLVAEVGRQHLSAGPDFLTLFLSRDMISHSASPIVLPSRRNRETYFGAYVQNKVVCKRVP